jgi:signal transduction histidine kinase
MADKATILYIEDDTSSQLLVQRMLTYSGYRVVVAARGLEGIDAAQRELPDLILVDINLPDMSGREVTTRLRGDDRFKNTPIVALTSQNQTGDREKALVAGATGYLNKPVDIDRLLEQILHYLRGGKDTADETALRTAQVAYSQELVSRLEAKVRELELTNSELRRMDRVKDDFIQLTAHELRTPLTLVNGYSRLIQESSSVKMLKQQSPEISMFVDGLSEAIDRMTRVIGEILTISRIATGRIDLAIATCDLGHIMKNIVDRLATATQQRNLLIKFDPTQWPPSAQIDAELIELGLQNIIGNAVKFTPDGGIVNISCKTGAGHLLIAVQDTGIGINKDDQQYIFNRFYTTNDTQLHSTSKTAYRGGGLGLGLAICRGIVEAHGGKIWVESSGRDEEKLPGSTFYINLPLQARTSQPYRKVSS